MAVLSINEVSTFRWTFDEDVTRYAAAGIGAMGVWRRKISDFGESRGIELLAEYNMRVSNLSWVGGFTGSDGRTFKESVEDAADGIRLAAEMNAACVILYSGPRNGHTHRHARRLLTEAISELTPVAEAEGVDIAIEPMHEGCAAEWTFLSDLSETLAFLDECSSPRLKLVVDTYHLGFNPELPARLSEIAPRLAIVQLGDGRKPPDGEQDRCPLGAGQVPLAEIVNSLKSAGYNGYYDVELLGQEVEAIDYCQLIQCSQRMYRELVGG